MLDSLTAVLFYVLKFEAFGIMAALAFVAVAFLYVLWAPLIGWVRGAWPEVVAELRATPPTPIPPWLSGIRDSIRSRWPR